MATHSSFLAWKIPWTEEPGRLRTMECKNRCQAVAMDACLLQSSSGLLSCAALRGCCGNGGNSSATRRHRRRARCLEPGWEALATASVSWTRGLGGEWGAELTEGGSHRGRRPSQWSWGLNMRGMRTGWGLPSTSSSLSQGFPKLSRSHLSPASSRSFSSPPLPSIVEPPVSAGSPD